MVSVGEIISSVSDNIKIGAVNRNAMFIRYVADEVYAMFQQNQARLGRPGRFFLDREGNSSYYPQKPKEDPPGLATYYFAVNLLRVMKEFKVVSDNTTLNVRPIDWFNGSGAFLNMNDYGDIASKSERGIPSRGQFNLTDRARDPMFGYHTFAGIDIQSIFVLGDVVTEPETMKTISYSTHRGKKRISKLGRTYSVARSRGARTVAGTMIFTVTDQHPLLSIYPSELVPKDMEYIKGTKQTWQPTLLPDQLPPFDMILIFQNEYGHAMQMALFGIDITDDGMAISINDLEIECVVQYTALTIDVPRRVVVDKNGVIDPLSIGSASFSAFWDMRQRIANEVGDIHQNPYALQSEYYEAIEAQETSDSLSIASAGSFEPRGRRNVVETSQNIEEGNVGYENLPNGAGGNILRRTNNYPRNNNNVSVSSEGDPSDGITWVSNDL